MAIAPSRPRTQRRLPRWKVLAPLLGVRRWERDRLTRRLRRALTVPDLADIARRRTPRSVFEYVDGAAEAGLGLERARQAFARVEFDARVLRDVASVDTGTTILGRRADLPLILAPTGFTRMMHHEGEPAVARAGATAGVPYTLSTMGTTSPADLMAAAPTGRNWFQLYLWRDRAATLELIESARAAGYDTLVLTVDTPVAGNRLRDARNGLTIPPTLNVRTLLDMSRHPSWWANLLTTAPLEFAALRKFDGTVAELVNTMFDPAVSFEDLAWLRSQWAGNLVVKGLQSVDDVRLVVDAGVDGIVVSNHGGRQLDRAATPLELLPAVVDAVEGRCQVFLDTGILSGADIVAALGMGADACMVGRAYLYGLMAGGERGVDRALDILRSEMTRTMQLMGAASVADLRGRALLRP
ncbi:alpha-hydroxy acid oxidase [Aeromicrobium choanae]|uniref:L-lactate dehydrogenase (Cytochrome) n=1 Tax=Aeromicrobium choanae TaxID=1736691 RepID=A0A1T4YWL9_9ACTN|nr:alpha-hydroxy acid oxidase [Aeromicrobium choanae]SKB06033.1 L-lactate dehydrogenase (cytochrome) [Aeromicrobium choanae]